MRKIIHGRRYDTETARYMGSHTHLWERDGRYYSEELYKKKTGEFFLYGEGNGLSPYADRYEDGWGPGDGFLPLTEEEAQLWIERYYPEDYEGIFGEKYNGDPVCDSDLRNVRFHAEWRLERM